MPTLIESLLPEYDHHEHHSALVEEPPQRAWERLHTLKVADLKMSLRLVRLRAGPSAWFGAPPPETSELRALDSFAPRQLCAEEPREVVLGDIARYTSAAPVRPDIPRGDLEAFSGFSREGWSKVAMNFHFEGRPEGTLISTETRVLTLGASAKRTFALYWFMIRAGSGLIRWDILRALQKGASPAG